MTGSGRAEILRQLIEPRSSDRELLARFVRERDQAAFAELVREHGLMVLGVCRRVTGHDQDAEDAFQAVFLLLARKPTSIRNPDLVGNWLYGVAVHMSQAVRRATSRRRRRELAVNVVPEKPLLPRESFSDFYPILDEELARLPSWYREAIVLCDLRGVPRERAAALLGVAEGTLSSRLANGRKKLAIRLRKRGITVSIAGITLTLSKTQAATVSTELFTQTCNLAALWNTGASIPRPLVKLTEGGMTVRKILGICVLATATLIAGMVLGSQPVPKPVASDAPIPPVVVAGTETIDQPVPDPKAEDKSVAFTSQPRLKTWFNLDILDGSKMIWNAQGDVLAIEGFKIDKGERETLVELVGERWGPYHFSFRFNTKLVGFTADGKQFVTKLNEFSLVSGLHELAISSTLPPFMPNAPQTQRWLNLEPIETERCFFAADGKSFRTVAVERKGVSDHIKGINVLDVSATTGKVIKKFAQKACKAFALSMDGKRLAIYSENNVQVFNVDSDERVASHAMPAEAKPLPLEFVNALTGVAYSHYLPSMAFSPDGRKLVISSGLGATGGWNGGDQRLPILRGGGLGKTVVLNADTGETLPALEDAECLDTSAGPFSFSKDGRLLALSGTQYDLKKWVAGPKQVEMIVLDSERRFLNVWDMQTGKLLKAWKQAPDVAFNPVRPVLAVLEANGGQKRLGLWDFSAESAEKK